MTLLIQKSDAKKKLGRAQFSEIDFHLFYIFIYLAFHLRGNKLSPISSSLAYSVSKARMCAAVLP